MLEKSFAFLKRIEETVDLKDDSRIVHYMMHTPVYEGGTWHDFVNIVQKYGIVPKTQMPESAVSTNTSEMRRLLSSLLRQCAAQIRRGDEYDMDAMMRSVHHLLCMSLGVPPHTFVWTYRRKKADDEADDDDDSADDNVVQNNNVTAQKMSPLQLFEEIDVDLDEYVALVHVPTKDVDQAYTVKYVGNVHEADERPYYNVSMKVMRTCVYNTVKTNEAVWFGVEFEEMRCKSHGLLHHNLFDYNRAFKYDTYSYDKEARLKAYDVDINHAMLITGYHMQDEHVVRWRVENSHGKNQKNGYLSMTHKWFERYVYMAVVLRSTIDEDQWTDMTRNDSIALEPWDIIAAVAHSKSVDS